MYSYSTTVYTYASSMEINGEREEGGREREEGEEGEEGKGRGGEVGGKVW